jgi:predicted nucleotidyltransferase
MLDPDLMAALRPALAQRPELELAIVFGSVAAGRQRPGSDLDIAVQARRPLTAEQRMTLVGELALASGRAVDLVDLRAVGEPLLGQILAHGRRLVGSDEAFAELVCRHLFDAADFLPYAQRIVEQRRRAWIAR